MTYNAQFNFCFLTYCLSVRTLFYRCTGFPVGGYSVSVCLLLRISFPKFAPSPLILACKPFLRTLRQRFPPFRSGRCALECGQEPYFQRSSAVRCGTAGRFRGLNAAAFAGRFHSLRSACRFSGGVRTLSPSLTPSTLFSTFSSLFYPPFPASARTHSPNVIYRLQKNAAQPIADAGRGNHCIRRGNLLQNRPPSRRCAKLRLSSFIQACSGHSKHTRECPPPIRAHTPAKAPASAQPPAPPRPFYGRSPPPGLCRGFPPQSI